MMVTRRGQRAAAVRLIVIIALLLMAMWLVWKVLLDVEPAPAPEVKVGQALVGGRAGTVLPYEVS